MPSPSHAHRRPRWLLLLGLLALALIAVVLLITRPWEPAGRLEVALDPSERAIPRERARVRLTVEGGTGSATVDAITDDGERLTGGREIEPGGRRSISLPLTERGRRVFGTCALGEDVRLRILEDGQTRMEPVALARDSIRCAPLAWAPPGLQDPERIVVADDQDIVRLESGRDYELVLPDHKRIGGLQVYGGRNVVIVGGHITVPPDAATDPERKALAFGDQTGTIHIEGVLIDASAGGQADGISVRAPEAILQVQNTRIVGLRGTSDGTHADVVQPWGGIEELRIDRLSGSSHFQGLQIPQDEGPIRRADLRSVDLVALPEIDGGGHMLWLTGSDCSTYPVSLTRFHVVPRADRNLATTVWPETGDEPSCVAQLGSDTIAWPRLPIEGEVVEGPPERGPFVPALVAGTEYRSPGYAGVS